MAELQSLSTYDLITAFDNGVLGGDTLFIEREHSGLAACMLRTLLSTRIVCLCSFFLDSQILFACFEFHLEQKVIVDWLSSSPLAAMPTRL